MPGTIQVSVLELMDSSGNAYFSAAREAMSNQLSLKVAMGKREYQTSGKEDFSFPVTSLRENLRVMMYSGEGNLISQTEIKVISVVEKGLWDDFFQLQGGGTAHLRMKFVLSEEEQMKIQEMRLSALKRKHQELLKDGLIDDFVKQRIGDPNSRKAENEMKEERNDQLNLRDQDKDVGPSIPSTLRDSAEGMKLLMDQEVIGKSGLDEEKKRIESALENPQERVSYVNNDNTDPQRIYSESPTTQSSTEESSTISNELKDQAKSTKKKKITESRSASSVRKMINAFEHSVPQQPGDPSSSSLSDASKTGTAGSLKRTSSEESELNKMFHGTLAKSFSADTLSNSNVDDNSTMPKSFRYMKQEGRHLFDRAVTKGASIQKSDNSPGEDKKKDSKESDTENTHPKPLNTLKSQVSTDTDKFQKLSRPENVTSSDGSTENVITGELGSSDVNLVKDNTFGKNIKPDMRQAEPNKSEESTEIVNEGTSFATAEVSQSPTDDIAAVKTSKSLPSGSSAKEDKVCESGENPILKTKSKLYKPKNGNITRDEDVKVSVEEHQKVIASVPKVESRKAELDLAKKDPHLIDMVDGSLKRNNAYIRRPMKQISQLNRASKDLTFICYRCHLMKELSAYGNCYDAIKALSNQREENMFGTFGIFVPHYFCLTTGSKQIRTLLHSCSICLGSLRDEQLPEKKLLQDPSATKIKKLNPESLTGISNILGRLLDQGARIIVIVVACGTLLLNVK